MRFSLLLSFLLLLTILDAQERFTNWTTEIHLHADRSAEVTETITVVAEGRTVRRGITRTVPRSTELLSIHRDGQEAAFTTRRRGRETQLLIGDRKKTIPPSRYTYVIRYRTAGAVAQQDTVDEFSYAVIGDGVELPIVRLQVHLSFPPGTTLASYACYTGQLDESGEDCSITHAAEGGLTFSGRGGFGLGRSFSIGAGFVSGSFDPTGGSTGSTFHPAEKQESPQLLSSPDSDDRSPIRLYACLLVLLLGALTACWYAITSWRQYGVDPPSPELPPGYAPPHGYSPAALSYLSGKGSSTARFTASLMSLATLGFLQFEQQADYVKLRKLDSTPALDLLPKEQQYLYSALFDGGDSVKLREAFDDRLKEVSAQHDAAIAEEHGALHRQGHNGRRVLPLLGICIGTLIVAVLLAAGAQSGGVFVAVGVFAFASLIGFGLYSYLIAKPSPDKVRFLTEIDAFRAYLGLSEVKRKQLPDAPQMNEHHYEELLPYAIAFGIHTKWTQYFGDLLSTGQYQPAYAAGGAAFRPEQFNERLTERVEQSTVRTVDDDRGGHRGGKSFSSGGGAAGRGRTGGGGAGGW